MATIDLPDLRAKLRVDLTELRTAPTRVREAIRRMQATAAGSPVTVNVETDSEGAAAGARTAKRRAQQAAAAGGPVLIETEVDTRQLLTLAQRIRDLRTLYSASIGPIRDFSAGTAKAAVAAGAASAVLVSGTGLAAGLLAVAGAASQAAGAVPLLVPALASYAAVALTAKVATLGVADAIKEELEPVTEDLSRNAQRLVDRVGDLVPALTGAKNAIQDAGFRGLADEVRPLAERFLPTLTRGARDIASTLNSVVRRAIDDVSDSTTQWQLAAVLADARTALQQFAPSLSKLPGVLIDIGAAAGPAFRDLARLGGDALGGLVDRLSTAVQSGALADGLERGVQALADLAGVASAAFSSVRSVVRAASEAVGGDLLGAINRVLSDLSRFLASAPGQDAVRAVFAAALPVLRTVAELAGQIGPELADLAPVVLRLADAFLTGLEPVIPVLGDLAEALGGALAEVLPAVSDVAVAVGGALTTAIQILTPVIGPLAEAIATLLSPTGVLATALTALAPVLPILASGFAEVVAALAAGLVPVIEAIAPVLPELAQAFADLAVALAEGLAQALIDMAPFLPGFLQALTDLLIAVVPLVPELLKLVAPLIRMALEVLPPLIAALVEVVPLFVALLNSPNWDSLIGFLNHTADATAFMARTTRDVVSALTAAVEWFASFAATLAGAVAFAVGLAVGVLTGFPEKAASAVTGLGGLLVSAVGGALASMRRAIATGLAAAIAWFTGLAGRISAAVGDLGSVLYEAGRAVIQGLMNGIGDMLFPLGGLLGRVGSFISEHKGPLDADLRLLIPHGRALMAGLMTGISDRLPDLDRLLASAVNAPLPGAAQPGRAAAGGNGVLRLHPDDLVTLARLIAATPITLDGEVVSRSVDARLGASVGARTR